VETLPERTQGPIVLAASKIASEAGLDSLEKILIAKRFGEEFYGTALHRLHGHRNVAVRRHENDRHLPVGRGKVALKFETASSRHSNIEHQASWAVRRGGIEEIGNRRKLLDIQADRAQKSANRLAKVGIVIDD